MLTFNHKNSTEQDSASKVNTVFRQKYTVQ